MNPWMFPALAVLVTCGWIGYERKSVATLEREITQLNERIQQAHSAGDVGGKFREAEEKARKEKDRKIDWKNQAGKIGQMSNGGMQDMRAMMRMQRLLMELSSSELCAQLDEIAALDIEDSTREQLQSMILGVLVEKDPKLALERFGNYLGDERSDFLWPLSDALGKLAVKDPAAAVAWLDQQVAAGKFESKSLDGINHSLVRLERMLVNALLKSDPSGATAHVAALPESLREELFQKVDFFQLEPKNEAAYANLVRGSLASDKVGGILANAADTLSMLGGFERVDGFIASARATDDEKKAIVEQVMKNTIARNGANINTDDLEKARAWGAGQSPGVVDKATGEALAIMIWEGGDFTKASELALQYDAKSGNDEVLAGFLKSNEVREESSEQAKTLIDKIKDPALREKIANLPEYKK